MSLIFLITFLYSISISTALTCEATAASSYTVSGAGQGNGVYTYIRRSSRVSFLSGGISLLAAQYKHTSMPYYLSIGIVSGTGQWWAAHQARWELRDAGKVLYKVNSFTKNQIPKSSDFQTINGVGVGPNLKQTCTQDISQTQLKYIGCYRDGNPRAFPVAKGRWYGDITSCAIDCKGYSYFALQDIIYNQQSQCYCGNDLTAATRHGTSTACKHGMGASWKNSIYKNAPIVATTGVPVTTTIATTTNIKQTQMPIENICGLIDIDFFLGTCSIHHGNLTQRLIKNDISDVALAKRVTKLESDANSQETNIIKTNERIDKIVSLFNGFTAAKSVGNSFGNDGIKEINVGSDVSHDTLVMLVMIMIGSVCFNFVLVIGLLVVKWKWNNKVVPKVVYPSSSDETASFKSYE